MCLSFFYGLTTLLGHGFLIAEVSRSQSDPSVGTLWTMDRPVAETFCLTTHNTRKRQTSMPPAEFEPVIPGNERPQTDALHRTATGIGTDVSYFIDLVVCLTTGPKPLLR